MLLDDGSVTELLLISDTVECSNLAEADDNGDDGHDNGDEVFILWL